MSDLVIVACVGSIGPTLVGAAAFVQATRGRREAAAANRAVNHQGPNATTLVEKVDQLSVAAAGLADEQRTITADIGELHKGVARCAVEISEARQQLTTHLAQHQADHETTAAAQRGDIERRRQ